MKFSELEFKPHRAGPMMGVQSIKEFSNGWAVSVIKGPYTYGGKDGLYELAVMKGGRLHYENAVADGDVRGHLTEAEVEELATQVESYKE